MLDFLNAIIPNVMSKPDELFESFGQTIYMVIVSGAISMVFGLFFGIILTATAPKGVLKNKVIFNILDKLVNIFRSIPFVILLTALIPLTRMVVGTAIGTKGAILPLIFGTVPFFTRQIESALAEVDYGLIEAAESMGNSPWEIIFRVSSVQCRSHLSAWSVLPRWPVRSAAADSAISRSVMVTPEGRPMSPM